jgi:hypothetical protein
MQFRQEVKGCRFLIVIKRIRPLLAEHGIAARRSNVSLNKQSDGLSSFSDHGP